MNAPNKIQQTANGQLMLNLKLIPHEVDGALIPQRMSDGYVNATAMCKAVGKLFADYQRLKTTEAFLAELAGSMGIPIDQLIFTTVTGKNEERGTWVHPDVAIHLGQWCSPKFAVAVARWVREWITGKTQIKGELPYHLKRYMANRSEIPPTHWSMLNELTFNLIAPLEDQGYRLPDSMVPDISEGKMFSQWLRKQGVNPGEFPTYRHTYEDGRVVNARLYPNHLLADFRKHFHEFWIQQKMTEYFTKRDAKALPYLPRLIEYSSTKFISAPERNNNEAGAEKISDRFAALKKKLTQQKP